MKNSMLTMGLAALLFAACSNDVTDEATQTQNDGNRYMAITLVTGAGTRAASDGGFAASDDEYLNVNGAYFFFYDQSGNAVTVSENGNYVANNDFKSWETTNALPNSVTAISSVIAVLTKMQGSTPAQVVALLNPTLEDVTALKNKSLDDVRKTTLTSGYTVKDSKSYFAMSNSVYNDATGATVYATPIKAANLATSTDNAEKNPVSIYVERVVAKVTVTEPTAAVKLEDAGDYLTDTELSVKINGWQVFNTATTTKLEKEIAGYAPTTSWDWNAADLYRSYWAVVDDTISLNKVDDITWGALDGQKATAYPFENTLATVEGKDNHTSIVIAGTLVDGKGNTVSLGRWLSKYYTETNLKIAVANYLANDLYTYDEDSKTWTSISADAISFKVNEKASYIADVVITGDFYAKGSTDKLDANTVSDLAAAVPTIRLWKDGMCYYYAEITHLNNEPAVVRNHQYALSINTITGIGTPVVDKDTQFDPERPTDEEVWYLDAKLYVQDWKVVSNSLDLVSK
jgi:hypothetical protein